MPWGSLTGSSRWGTRHNPPIRQTARKGRRPRPPMRRRREQQKDIGTHFSCHLIHIHALPAHPISLSCAFPRHLPSALALNEVCVGCASKAHIQVIDEWKSMPSKRIHSAIYCVAFFASGWFLRAQHRDPCRLNNHGFKWQREHCQTQSGRGEPYGLVPMGNPPQSPQPPNRAQGTETPTPYASQT